MRWDIGIDLGTSQLRMAEVKAGPVLAEASCLGFRGEEKEPFVCGDAAAGLLGRACRGTRLSRPLRDGTLENATDAHLLMEWAFSKSALASKSRRFSALITCSPTARPVQQQALLSAALDAGATDAGLIRSDAAAALGASMNILAPEASLAISLGMGQLTATLFSMGRVAGFGALPYGMGRIDERVRRFIRANQGFDISLGAASDLKHAMGTALTAAAPAGAGMTTAGLNLVTRLPGLLEVAPQAVLDACADVVRELIGMLMGVLEGAPSELLADLSDAGCVLTGGGALLSGLDKRIGDALGIPCRVAEAPQSCAIRGLSAMLENPDAYPAAILDTATRSTWR